MTKVTCVCGYEWETKSKKGYVSCPNCLNKAKINKVEMSLDIDMKKFNAEIVVDGFVEPMGKTGAVKVGNDHMGKKAKVVISKENYNGRTDKEEKQIADLWENSAI